MGCYLGKYCRTRDAATEINFTVSSAIMKGLKTVIDNHQSRITFCSQQMSATLLRNTVFVFFYFDRVLFTDTLKAVVDGKKSNFCLFPPPINPWDEMVKCKSWL